MVTHLRVVSANELDYLLGLVMLNVASKNNNSRTTYCSYILRLFISFIILPQILPYNTRQTISTVYTQKKRKKPCNLLLQTIGYKFIVVLVRVLEAI